ncbi:ATP-dependent RNA helicase A [Oopsacas minuta]|uniref:ATP-dependent RNA helicase A n=1 Tax=Oopsacas minuta TaxID=111878 RepID=A0AAV7KI41_9METZ|nr:ATP-dependent RNA helicase A [Oopsacas minuta]
MVKNQHDTLSKVKVDKIIDENKEHTLKGGEDDEDEDGTRNKNEKLHDNILEQLDSTDSGGELEAIDTEAGKKTGEQRQYVKYDDDDDDDDDNDVADENDSQSRSDGENEQDKKQNDDENAATMDMTEHLEDNILTSPTQQEQTTSTQTERAKKVLGTFPQVKQYTYDQEKYRWCEITFSLSLSTCFIRIAPVLTNLVTRCVVRQADGIKRAFIKEENGKISITTDGANIKELWQYHDKLDMNRLYTNDIMLIANTYGIEAATKAISRELSSIFKMYGINIDPRHLSLIADYQTVDGRFRGCNRISMECNTSPFQQMSFETPMKFLKDSAIGRMTEFMDSPSANIMSGQLIMLRDAKAFLKSFNDRRKTSGAEYTVENETGDYSNQNYFYCECRIPGFENIGVGESHLKRFAEHRAAKHLCQQLRDMGLVDEDVSIQIGLDDPDPPSEEETVVYTGIVAPQITVEERKRPAPPSQSEVYGAGGWSLINAKSRLNLYMQQTKQTKEMNIYAVGPDHHKSFIGEISLYVPSCRNYITIKEHGSTKKVASNTCALSALSKLYMMGAIEEFQSKEEKKLALSREMPELTIPQELVERAEVMLAERGIQLVEESPDEPISVITEKPQTGVFPTSQSEVIQWAEPHIDWNPWTGRSTTVQLHLGHSNEERDHLENQRLLEEYRMSSDSASGKARLQSRQQLTISSRRDDILRLVEQNQVVLIRGDTGSGKTTQVPQFILDSYIEKGCGSKCNILVTQPRRISAIAVSERVAAERGEQLGISVGYSVRFDNELPRQLGSILYCTTGILCRKLELGLNGISHLIMDEVHERDINTDFLFVAIRDMMRTYPSFHVVIMSATVDTTIFSNFFFNCPVVEVLGKMFPVQEYFLEDAIEFLEFHPPPSKIPPADDEFVGDSNKNLECDRLVYKTSTCLAMAKMVEREISFELIESLLDYFSTLNLEGSVLIFLPGWNLIYALSQYLTENPKFSPSKYLILPLHSSVPREDQAKIFHPTLPGVTKVIIATNIAETSITINDVVFVIDSAKAKIKHFTSYNNMTHYITVWASKTNLEQRMGRAGRVQAGFCFHLCSKARYDALPQHMIPEILRSPLLDIVLNIKLLMLGDISNYLSRCIEPPTDVAIQEAIYLLKVKNALDMEENITPLGSIVARLPLEPRIAYMLILSTLFGEGDTFTTITAAMSFQEPYIIKGKRLMYRHRNLGKAKFSDHISLNNVYQNWLVHKERSNVDAENFCYQFQLNKNSLNMVHDAKQQLQRILMDQGFPEECFMRKHSKFVEPENAFVITALLCVGLYPNVAVIEEKRKLRLPEKKHALIHKTSNLCPMTHSEDMLYPSPYVIFSEKLRTKTVSAKQLTMVELIHLALFGSNIITAYEYISTMDSWIDFVLPFRHAAIIGGIREALSELLSQVAINPPSALLMQPSDVELIDLITELTKLETYPDKHEFRLHNTGGFSQSGRYHRRGNRYPSASSYPQQSYVPQQPAPTHPGYNYQSVTSPISYMDTGDYQGGYTEQAEWNPSPRGRFQHRGGYRGHRRQRSRFNRGGRQPFRSGHRYRGGGFRGRRTYY